MSHSTLHACKPLLTGAFFAIAGSAMAACSGPAAIAPPLQTQSSFQDASRVHRANASAWNFATLDNPDDGTLSRLTGINNVGKICGFTGNPASGKDPSKGFVVADYGKDSFRNENYPGAVDTEVTSLSNTKALAGFYISTQGWIFGWILQDGVWNIYKDPELRKGSSNITELLGLNDAGLAVGFYTDQFNVNHAFELNATTGKFHGITPPGGISVEATGINGKGDIVGIMTTADGTTKSWLLKGGEYTEYGYPHSTNTEAQAVNWQDQVVGFFVDGSGLTHGFLLSNPIESQQWTQVDEPSAKGPTVLTSIEDHDYMVGWYIDSRKHTHGFLATPQK